MPATLADRHLSDLISTGRIYATPLVTLVIDRWGAEALNWDPQTLESEFADELGVVLTPSDNDKLQAGLSVLTTDQFYRDPLAFGHVCLALDGQGVTPELPPAADPDAMAWGVTEALLLDGPGHPPFSPEVARYVGCLLKEQGMYHPPSVLKFADYPEEDKVERAGAVFGNDVAGFGAWFSKSNSDAEAVEHTLKSRLAELIQQMDTLPLRNRDPHSWDSFKSRVQRITG